MRKNISFITLLIIMILPITGASCSQVSTAANSSISKPAVIIEYNGIFGGETSSGYLNLNIDMTIENRGYKTFKTEASSFQVKVGEYLYKPQNTQLEAMEITDGDRNKGTLNFQVPPEAAMPNKGYVMKYSGQTGYNIEWIKTQNALSSTAEPVVNIGYSTELMWISAPLPGIDYLEIDKTGNLFLVVEMTIENKGYESFNINPDYFSVEASSEIRSVVSKVQGELIDWRVLDIQNNGNYKGSLLFPIPTEIAQSFYRWDYKMMYSGIRAFNIQWTKINVTKSTIDPSETKLQAVYLRDGENIKGRLVYYISPALAAPNAVYELLYAREKSSHNVQFFDRPDAIADVNRNAMAYPVIKTTYSTSVMRLGQYNRLYLIANVLIENKGYDSFYTAPAYFYLEVSY